MRILNKFCISFGLLITLSVILYVGGCGKNVCLGGFGQCKAMFSNVQGGGNNGPGGNCQATSTSGIILPGPPNCEVFTGGAWVLAPTGGNGTVTAFANCPNGGGSSSTVGTTTTFTASTNIGTQGTQVNCTFYAQDSSTPTPVQTNSVTFYVVQGPTPSP